MSSSQDLSKMAFPKEAEGEWVDFPASPDPAPWEALLQQADRRPAVSCSSYRGARRAAGGMTTSLAVAARGLLVTTAAVATLRSCF
jgi:hypothetical protein